MGKKTVILVCAHKQDPYTRNEGVYKAIQVGKALHPELDLGYLNDNEGDNISDKNPQWCELTALYWGWKNIKDVEYIGLCHYRRYFDYDITDDNIDRLLKNRDILLVERLPEPNSVAVGFMKIVSMEDFYIFLDVLLRLRPEYKQAVIDYCYNSNLFYLCTMFVTRKNIYDEFCETFFPVLEQFEKIAKPYGYSRLNRNVAYLGELSLGLFVTHKKLRKKFVPMLFCPPSPPKKFALVRKIKSLILKKKKNLGFLIMNRKVNDIELYEPVILGLKNDGIYLSIAQR